MKKVWITTGITMSIIFAAACGGETNSSSTDTTASQATDQPTPQANDDKRGVGKFTHVELNSPLDQNLVKTGQTVYDVKCASCHKLTDEKLVGPGWKDVTTRRTPEWIMNFVTNPEEMLNKDPQAMSMLEICLVRMPNQNLSDEEARASLEYMFANDGKK